MTVTCNICATANPDGSRFCNACGSQLPEQAALAEERKVITALFSDLVGFTATSETADPEDVDRMLSRYFAVARSQIEAHGGIVEKFIGDAVVGVFGVPAAHEDDPERAVLAALRICNEAAQLPALRGAALRLRIGINTGEALVRLNVTPRSGERFLAGDAINTASRIQSVAPEMGVAAGEATYDATKQRFEYEELPPATVKGKAEPIRVFHAIAPRARPGLDLTRSATSPLVGRAAELRALTELFDAGVAERSPRFVTIVGEPGLGKSRLVAELLAHVDAQPFLVTWHQGRCLPYGRGISFWALGEIVKSQAGILESDSADVAIGKLDSVLPRTDEMPWLRERLAPLLGIESGSTSERDEQFTAWRRFLELMARERPIVLVFEDLHWADDAMLDFLEDLIARAGEVPMLVVATTRPELDDRRPAFARTGANRLRLDLTPLSAYDSRRLIAGLVGGTGLPPAVQAPLLERAAGNPLFAQEFVRLLRDRDLLVETDDGLDLRPGAELPMPGSVQALIAARLDALPGAWKSLLADAAVIGNVFWVGAVSAMGDRDAGEVAQVLRGLDARQFVRKARRSSMAGEDEYTFGHILARDVAYAALPRAVRAARHAAAARWIELRTAGRVDDVADVLAHHYSTALDLARAADDADQARDLEAPAFHYLSLAGERASGLDANAAVTLFERSLAVATEDHPDRPAALVRYGMANAQLGRFAEAVTAMESALAEYRARDDRAGTAEAIGRMASPLRELGDARAPLYVREAVDLLEPLGPSPQLLEALQRLGAVDGLAGRLEASMATLRRALASIEATPGLREVDVIGHRGNVIGWIGLTRAAMGDSSGSDDVREGIALTAAAGQSSRTGHLYNNLAALIGNFEGPEAARAVHDEAIEFGTRRGLRGFVTFYREARLVLGFDTGDHDALLTGLPSVQADVENAGSVLGLMELRSFATLIALIRGEAVDPSTIDWLEATAHRAGDIDSFEALATAAHARLARGETEAAQTLLEELTAIAGQDAGLWWFPRFLPGMVRTAIALGDVELAARLMEGVQPLVPYINHSLVAARAALAEARGDLNGASDGYADAASRWEGFGVVPEQAFALLGRGRVFVALGRHPEATPPLRRARTIFKRLHAAPSLAEIDRLLRARHPRPAAVT